MTRSQARWIIRALIERLRRDLDILRDPIEGLDDLGHLDLKGGTREAVNDLEQRILRRRDILFRAEESLGLLLSDGYPEEVRMEAGEPVLRDLADQARTIRRASELFETLPAVELNLTYSEPERK